ncbi:MAG TPA: hypothetical protein VHY78_08350 [Stellaceae bacterium]|nr:hypothetical protein [Stellaceae bacterium]
MQRRVSGVVPCPKPTSHQRSALEAVYPPAAMNRDSAGLRQ